MSACASVNVGSTRVKATRDTSVWTVFTPLAAEYEAVNLGQGFPSWNPPPFVVDAAQRSFAEQFHQYAPSVGLPHLNACLARRYSHRRQFGGTLDPHTQVCVTNGATEALYCSLQALLDPEDELVTFAPFFDQYADQVALAGARLVSVLLTPGDRQWSFEPLEFENAFSSKTKVFLLNTPHNPSGKVFTPAEMRLMQSVLERHPSVTVVLDEVYSSIIFDSNAGVSLLEQCPSLRDRTLVLSSVGKTFSVTGWKIGWAVGNAALVRAVQRIHQSVCFSVCTPLQKAVVDTFERAEQPYKGEASYYDWLRNLYRRKRDQLIDALRSLRLTAYVPEGAFFIVVDTSCIEVPETFVQQHNDWAMAMFWTCQIGVCVIPMSPFYSLPQHKRKAQDLVRIAFCKSDDDLLEATRRLEKLRPFIRPPASPPPPT